MFLGAFATMSFISQGMEIPTLPCLQAVVSVITQLTNILKRAADGVS